MKNVRLFWQLFLSYVLVTLFALAPMVVFGWQSLKDFYYGQVQTDLEARARLFAPRAMEGLETADHESIDRWAKKLGEETGTRITVIEPGGRVLADSRKPPQAMENHKNRPEISEAWKSGEAEQSVRYSTTIREDLMYVAVPLFAEDQPLVTVRAACSVAAVDRTLATIQGRIMAVALVAFGLIVGVSLLLARRVSQPLVRMTQAAKGYAEGDFVDRIEPTASRELATLGDAMNTMASQLARQIDTILRQRNELQTVLASMVEGVLALDTEKYILSLNAAAADLLNVDEQSVRGRPVYEVLRKAELLRFIDTIAESREATTSDIELTGDVQRTLQLVGTPLRDGDDNEIGLLIVLHDITRQRQLEHARSQFFSNVSHELRTPLSSIRASAETLLSGALEDEESARGFVQTIQDESDRLISVIDDVFTLSRIERESKLHLENLVPTPVCDVLRAAVTACQEKARAKDVEVVADCDGNLQAKIHVQLLQQALRQLIDNAITFGPAGAVVQVAAEQTGDEVVISVFDKGPGIEEKHLSRLFERFYRADDARSRELGGTGLGLAIVKHIARAHGGSVDVESKVGEGSQFQVRLPKTDKS
jgi:two-component system phosphate regulon sensor histidine kinase PhoR